MRGFRDRDFLQTKEGFFFCVVGQIHPSDRVISYIKYIVSESGLWGNGKEKYDRILKRYTISNLLKTFNYLKQNYPQYMFYSPADNVTVTAVPKEFITKHFKPEKKLAQLRETKKLDLLQKKLIRFTNFLEEISDLPKLSFGVTGSLLLDIHNSSFSDLDIIVYGRKESWKLKNALTEKSNSEVFLKNLEGNALSDWCFKKSKQYPLTSREAFEIYKRKWNLGLFENRWVSIHPVKLENEIQIEYGTEIYTPCGQVTVEAVVVDNSDSIFLPAIYKVDDVTFFNGDQFGDVTEVITYEGLYGSLADSGEKIRVKGKLEKVVNQETKKIHYRILVGSSEGKGKEYIKFVE